MEREEAFKLILYTGFKFSQGDGDPLKLPVRRDVNSPWVRESFKIYDFKGGAYRTFEIARVKKIIVKKHLSQVVLLISLGV